MIGEAPPAPRSGQHCAVPLINADLLVANTAARDEPDALVASAGENNGIEKSQLAWNV